MMFVLALSWPSLAMFRRRAEAALWVVALNRKGGNAKKLLDAVPAEARHDAGYIFAHVHFLRHADKCFFE
jgi:hypothetical protein